MYTVRFEPLDPGYHKVQGGIFAGLQLRSSNLEHLHQYIYIYIYIIYSYTYINI